MEWKKSISLVIPVVQQEWRILAGIILGLIVLGFFIVFTPALIDVLFPFPLFKVVLITAIWLSILALLDMFDTGIGFVVFYFITFVVSAYFLERNWSKFWDWVSKVWFDTVDISVLTIPFSLIISSIYIGYRLKVPRKILETNDSDVSAEKLVGSNKVNNRFQPLFTNSQKVAQSVSFQGYVYLMRTNTGYYKIGHSNNPVRRRKEVEKDHNVRMSIVHTIPTNDPRGLENRLHKKYKSRLVIREIFNLTDEDIEEIMAMKD